MISDSLKKCIKDHCIASQGILLSIGLMEGMGYSERHIKHVLGIESPSNPYVDGEDGIRDQKAIKINKEDFI